LWKETKKENKSAAQKLFCAAKIKNGLLQPEKQSGKKIVAKNFRRK